jgi:outer membrane protein
MRRPFAVLVAAVGFLPAAGAQEPPPEHLSLPQAISTALAHSPRLGAADAGLGSAEATADEAQAARLPRLELSETYLRTTNPVLVFGGLLGQEGFTEQDFDVGRLNRPDPFTNFHTQLSLSQPLWTGGRIAHGVAATLQLQDAAAADRERTRQEVVQQVVEAYTGAVLARQRLEVAGEARDTARAHVELVQDLFDNGLVVESDLLQAQVRLSEVEEMVTRSESAVATSEAGLNLAMGLPLDRHHQLDEEVTPREGDLEDLESLVTAAAEQRPDLAATAARVEAATEQTAAARADRLPELGLHGSWEVNGEDFLAGDGTNWTVMVGLRFTAFDGTARRARIRRAEEERKRAARLSALQADRASLEVRQAWHEVEAAGKRLEEARRSVTLARRSMSIVEDRYKEGLTTLVELLDAETGLTRARVREVAARRDLLHAQTMLDLAGGRI